MAHVPSLNVDEDTVGEDARCIFWIFAAAGPITSRRPRAKTLTKRRGFRQSTTHQESMVKAFAEHVIDVAIDEAWKRSIRLLRLSIRKRRTTAELAPSERVT